MRLFSGICAAVIALGIGPAILVSFGLSPQLALPHALYPADPDDFLVTGISRTNNTSVTLVLQLPPGFTNRVGVFGCQVLSDPLFWQLTATTPPATSRIAEVTMAWPYASGFFRVGDADTDSDGDGMLDFWEERHGLCWTNAADACGNPDGDGLINLHEYWCQTDPQTVDGAQYALSDAALAIDSRIAGRNPTNALPLFENYLANGANGVFIRNTNCWAIELDLTCCSPWNSCSAQYRAGTLISPRHVLFAAHFDQIPTNSTLTFVDRQNNVVTRTLVAKKRHPDFVFNYPDITVGLLDSDVPTNQISFAKVLSDDYADYIRDGARLPAIRLDQEEKALVGDVWYVTLSGPTFESACIVSIDPSRLAFFEDVINYDSGNPAFILINGQPVLLTVWTEGLAGSGTSATAFKADINQLMSDLSGGYQLTEIELSNFSPLP